MNPEDAPAPPEGNYDPHAKVGNTLTVTQPGERTICEIKRHPIGIVGIYVAMGLMIVVTAVLAFAVAPHISSNSTTSGSATKIGAALFILVAIVALAFTYISTKVYWGNSWVVTSDSVTQVDQSSLFHRQSSQLSLGNLEDVTAEQNGILTHIFNYGLLKVETAGERSKFVFPYCPNPNYYAKQILEAREGFEQNRGGEGSYAQPGPGPGPGQTNQATDQPLQVGDPGYGAFKPYQPPATSTTDYPSDSTDQGINVNT